MDLSYSAEELSFRGEVREWLSANLPADIRDKVVNYYGLSKDEYLRWHRILAAKGWSVLICISSTSSAAAISTILVRQPR